MKIYNINFLAWSFWQTDFSLHYHDYSFISRLMNWMWEMIKWMTTIFKTTMKTETQWTDRGPWAFYFILLYFQSIVLYIVKSHWTLYDGTPSRSSHIELNHLYIDVNKLCDVITYALMSLCEWTTNGLPHYRKI